MPLSDTVRRSLLAKLHTQQDATKDGDSSRGWLHLMIKYLLSVINYIVCNYRDCMQVQVVAY